MTFSSEKQRKAVMAMLSRLNSEMNRVRSGGDSPLMVRISSDSEEDLRAVHNKMISKIDKEISDKRAEINRENYFSEKERGSVPLLETTYVIRGGQPKERQTTKRLLDVIGNEPALMDVNTVRIDPDLEVPFEFIPEAKTLSIRAPDLHVKGSDIPVDLAIGILAQAILLKSPQSTEDYAFDKAKETVSIYLLERQHKEQRIRDIENAEVYTVGAETQPDYEISEYTGPMTTPIEAKIVVDSGAGDQTLGGVPASQEDLKRQMEEAEKSSIYYTGGLNENK